MAGKKGMKGGGGRRAGAGRPPFKATDHERKIVKKWAAFGMTHENIASLLREGQPISTMTLQKVFRNELNLAHEQADMAVIESLYIQAVGADAVYHEETGRLLREEVRRVPAASIFWLKARRKWRDSDGPAARDDDQGGSGQELRIVITGGLPQLPPPPSGEDAPTQPETQTSGEAAATAERDPGKPSDPAPGSG